jgi:N-acetylmuramic acid 6-phosphate etherase
VMLRLGRVYKGLMLSMRVSNDKLRRRALDIICDIARVDGAAAEEALGQADDDIRLAALIALGATPEAGEASLAAAHGNLRIAIEQLEAGN